MVLKVLFKSILCKIIEAAYNDRISHLSELLSRAIDTTKFLDANLSSMSNFYLMSLSCCQYEQSGGTSQLIVYTLRIHRDNEGKIIWVTIVNIFWTYILNVKCTCYIQQLLI